MKIALVGNPNTGKSSIFNLLTGMRQHVGNFPGVTVDLKVGKLEINGVNHELIDLPGTYSIYARSKDESIVYNALTRQDHSQFPDALILVLDAANLERNLLLASQVYDLGLPTVVVLNMNDLAQKRGIEINQQALAKLFPEAEFVEANARAGTGRSRIKEAVENAQKRTHQTSQLCALEDTDGQEKETVARYAQIQTKIPEIVLRKILTKKRSNWDKILVHPVFGYLIFAFILLVVFQSIYAIANYPMDWIDNIFGAFGNWLALQLPPGAFTDLLTQGIVTGIGGILIFIPQIALLFFFMAILEETGYLSRVVFIMDRLMRPLGLNGKSIVPMMSSVACAIPGVMAARTISDRKERLITVLVAPLMSCSARIPVYTLLIALVIPNIKLFGFVHLQGLVLFGLYLLGIVMALIVALILKVFIRTQEKGFLLLELPEYKAPRWGNVGLVVWEKVRIFVWDAGKIILAISILLWALGSYGPSERMEKARVHAEKIAVDQHLNDDEASQLVASKQLENSYIGIMGKTIEPIIAPIGYDWKIGIALLTSFAAREVFVGSMATIYAVQDDGASQKPLLGKMRAEQRSDGKPVYSLATGVSLMVFYAFAMMCMATLAVVKRETKSWKWPLIQVGYMGVLAYLGAFISYQLLS